MAVSCYRFVLENSQLLLAASCYRFVFKNGGQLHDAARAAGDVTGMFVYQELDYQEANDLLISTTPHAQLQLMNLGLGGLMDDDDEPVDRSRSPSPPRIFHGDIIT